MQLETLQSKRKTKLALKQVDFWGGVPKWSFRIAFNRYIFGGGFLLTPNLYVQHLKQFFCLGFIVGAYFHVNMNIKELMKWWQTEVWVFLSTMVWLVKVDCENMIFFFFSVLFSGVLCVIAEITYRCEAWSYCLFPKLLDPAQQTSLSSTAWSVEFIPGM